MPAIMAPRTDEIENAVAEIATADNWNRRITLIRAISERFGKAHHQRVDESLPEIPSGGYGPRRPHTITAMACSHALRIARVPVFQTTKDHGPVCPVRTAGTYGNAPCGIFSVARGARTARRNTESAAVSS